VAVRLPVTSALKKQLKAMTISFSYEVLSNPAFTNLIITLPAAMSGAQEKAGKKIWAVLQRADIQKDEDSPSVLEIALDAKEQGRVQGLSENNTFITVMTSATCVLKQNDREVLSFSLESAKGMGSTAEAGFIQSLENLKLKKNIPAIIEKLRGASSAPKAKIAVFPLKNNSGVSDWYELAQSLTGMIITGLINSNKFDVVEREMLEKIMEEKKFGMTGATDLKEDIQAAQLAGAAYLVVGGVGQQAGKVEADVRLVSVATGSAVTAANGTAAGRQDLRMVSDQIVEKLKKAKLQ
jgi:TolB-like protein